MTRDELPPQAVSIKDAVTRATCTAATVQALERILHNDGRRAPASKKQPINPKHPNREGKPARANKSARNKPQSRLSVAVLDDNEAAVPELSLRGKLRLATDVVNNTLKVLTAVIQSPSQQQVKSVKRLSGSESNQACARDSALELNTPLRALSINRISNTSDQKCHSPRLSSATSNANATALLATAKCGSVAFASLRSIGAQKISGMEAPGLQLESGMSAFIGKLLALGFHEMAIQEIQHLRRRLDRSNGSQVQGNGGAPNVKVPTTMPKPGSIKELLPDLLAFQNTNARGPLLNLMITSQFQVLKIVAASSSARAVEGAVKNLDLSNPSSPAVLIEQQIDQNSPQTSSKAAHQLASLSNLLLQICASFEPGEQFQVTGQKKSICPSTAFQYQVLALEIRLKWWRIAGHEGDAWKEILKPFNKYLGSFRRRSNLSEEAKYRHCQGHAERLLMQLNVHQKGASTLAQSALQAISGLQLTLADLARGSSNYQTARQWMNESDRSFSLSKASESQRCAFLCQRATLRVRAHPELGSELQILGDMSDLSATLDQNLGEDLDEIAEIVIALNGHRKSILALVRTHHQLPPFASSGFVIQCFRFFCYGIKLISTFNSRLEMQSKEREKAATSLSKWQLVWDIANPFIESIAMLARSSMACAVEDWNTIDAGLQHCIRLAKQIYGTDWTKTPSTQEGDAATSCLVSISNSYWCRFLHIKQHLADNVEMQKLLAASIEAMRGQPISLQDAALLPAKLEKQASLYESSKDYHQAAEAYAQIVRILIVNGCVSSAVEAATRRSLQTVFQEMGVIGLLGRSLIGHQRAMSYGSAEASLSRLSFDSQKLSISEKGLILEYQLTATSSKVISHGYSPTDSKLIQELVSALFSIYAHDEYPIRRLRVYVKLVHLQLHCSASISPNIHEQLSQERARDGFHSFLGKDSGLEPYIAHLDASRDICTMLCSRNVDTEHLDRSLAIWFDLLQGCIDLQTLQKRVDDIADWLLQLEALMQHLELQGLELQRVMVLQLIIKVREIAVPLRSADLISELNALGVQYARLGYSGHAGMILQRAQRLISTATPSWPSTIGWHLAYAEYLLSIGGSDKSESHLSIAQDLFKSPDHRGLHRHQTIQLLSDAASLYAQLSVARGDYSRAFFFCRLRVKLLRCIWSRSEKRSSELISHKTPCNLGDKTEGLADAIASLKITKSPSISALSKKGTQHHDSGTCALIPRLFDALTSLAELYAHGGLLAEGQYYMEQSAEVANNAFGTSFQNRYHVQLGQYLVRGSNVEDAVFHLEKAEATCKSGEPNKHLVSFYIALAERFAKSDELPSAMSTLALADSTLEELMQTRFIDRLGGKQCDVAVPGEHDLSFNEVLAPTKSNAKARGKAKVVAGRHASTTQLASNTAATPRSHGSVALKQERGRILRRQALIALQEGNLDRAEHLISDADEQTFQTLDRITSTMLSATLATRRALTRIATDLVFCVIPESTMCCPSTAPTSKHRDISPDDCQVKTIDQAAGPRGRISRLNAKVTKHPRTSAVPDFVGLFNQAQEHFDKIRSLMISAGSTADLHTLVDGLIRNLVMLSAFPSLIATHVHSPLYAMYVMELGRNVAVVRQRQALRIEQQLSLAPIADYWPAKDPEDTTLFNEIVPGDLASFQSEYLDIIPESWKVISLTLSESHDEIRVAKFRLGHSPFILNLPLARHAQDGDEEPFGFEQGKAELRDIIELANYSTHDAPDTSRKGAKTEWWDTRAALDARLKDLLANIENIWFGGFRGILGQDFGTPDLLSRFQQSLHEILDKYLPSRQKQTKTKKQNRHLLLDSHVLELFVAVGNPNESELDEKLLDLLYFVIDILQFHGERNAYDEVDFDAITVELLDALRQYHEAAKNEASTATSQHTILILDKALHCFPWESLPCVKGQAVSRLPSLGCLRDRILQQAKYHQLGTPTSTDPIMSLNRHSGAYVLNPSGDLTATQSRFEESLEKLTDWGSVVNREPGEDELKMALESKDILLYFGHGSGSQYIRSRTIRKLDKCAVALLMGCSSGALTEAGEYESYGTPINYIQAGCPAVLATLWDVTDKDIDRFSQTVLEKWGLFEAAPSNVSSSPVKKGAKSRGKSKARMAKSEDTERRSLDQAVVAGRDSCIMRYLNGAAPVIYGVPVVLS